MSAVAECGGLCSEVEDRGHAERGRGEEGVHARGYVAIDAESDDGDEGAGAGAGGCRHGEELIVLTYMD